MSHGGRGGGGGEGYGAVSPNDTWGKGGLKSVEKVSRIISMTP
jgi:hypothetical protein